MADSTPGHFADELAAKLNLSNGKRQLTNRFEELPPEVRRHIFCFLDLQQLSTLIHASPVYFQQYLEDRKSLLCGCLGRSLGSIAVDAFTIHRFASLDDEQKRGIPRFLKEYSDNTAQRCFPLSDNLADTEVVSMAAFHLHVAKPLSEYFGRWLLENLARQPVSEDTSKTDDRLGVTPSEATRLTRATYRFHLLCQMGVPVDYDYRRTSSLTNIHGLLDILQPWEAEEMFCFYQFAHHKYEKLLGEVREDLVQDDPEFAADHDRPSTPEGGFRWSRPWDRDSCVEGWTLYGLPLLHSVLMTQDHGHLASTLQKHLARSNIPIDEWEFGAFGDMRQPPRLTEAAKKRDQMQEDRLELHFQGDDDPDAPPLAWVKIWGGMYSNLYGGYVSNDLRRWGYVFWDAATLEAKGAEDLLEIQWNDWNEYTFAPRAWSP